MTKPGEPPTPSSGPSLPLTPELLTAAVFVSGLVYSQQYFPKAETRLIGFFLMGLTVMVCGMISRTGTIRILKSVFNFKKAASKAAHVFQKEMLEEESHGK